MNVKNAFWKAEEVDGMVSLYETGIIDPIMVVTVEQFRALKAIIEQLGI